LLIGFVSMDPNFIKHLNDLAGSNQELRRQAETLKESQIVQNTAAYLLNLSTALVSDNVEDVSRQLAGIIIKNAINGPNEITQRKHQQMWLNIPESQRSEIKKVLFSGLASPNNYARKGASFAVASIAMAELTVNEWLDLIPTLAGGIKQDNPVVQEGALQTIALICEDIDPIPDHLVQQSGEILTVIAHCAKADLPVEVRRASVSAMYGALAIVSNNFEQKPQRDRIMEIICNACKDQDTQIQTDAIRCLVKTAEIYYSHLDDSYMAAIWEITSNIMRTDSVAAPFTVEFWSTIAETERDIEEEEEFEAEHSNFASKILSSLVPLLCENLLKQVDTTADDEEWNMAAASAACIVILSECTRDKIVQIILPFIQLINNDNWRQREASTMAFGSVLSDSWDSEEIVDMVGKVIAILMKHLTSDPHECVRSTSAWAISKIASTHPAVIQRDTQAVIQALVSGLSNEDPVIAYYSCFGLLQILMIIYDGRSEEPSNDLSKIFLPLFQELVKAVDREDADESKLRITAYETINRLIEVSPLDCIAQTKSMISPFLGKLEASFSPSVDEHDKKQIQSYIPLVLQTITKRIGSEVSEFAQPMYETLTKIFQTRNAIVDEALNTISTLFENCPQLVQAVFGSFLPYFTAALKNFQDISILKSGLICLGSLCDSLEENFFKFDNGTFCDGVVNTLRDHLQNPEVDQDMRPLIIESLTELAFAIGAYFAKYFIQYFSVFCAASDVAIPPGETNDDHIEYVLSLRESLLESVPPVLHAMCLANKQAEFITCLSKLVPYMQGLWNDTDYRTKNIVSLMIGLLGDLFEKIVPAMEKDLVNQFLALPFVQGMLQHGMHRSPNPETRKTAEWAYSQFLALNK